MKICKSLGRLVCDDEPTVPRERSPFTFVCSVKMVEKISIRYTRKSAEAAQDPHSNPAVSPGSGDSPGKGSGPRSRSGLFPLCSRAWLAWRQSLFRHQGCPWRPRQSHRRQGGSLWRSCLWLSWSPSPWRSWPLCHCYWHLGCLHAFWSNWVALPSWCASAAGGLQKELQSQTGLPWRWRLNLQKLGKVSGQIGDVLNEIEWELSRLKIEIRTSN